MFNCGIFTFLVCILYTLENVRSDYILSINANSNSSNLFHFWKSTGFCPPEPRNDICNYLQRNDVKINLILIGALPNKSINYVRIHWLLDLITINSFNKDGTPIYNYTCADLFFDFLHKQNLKPNFELMGNPSSYFNNLLDKNQKRYWEILIFNTIFRYIERYGIKYVSKWKFETWNEPDLKGYNTLNFTLSSYFSYITSSKSALNSIAHSTNTTLRLGGPAGLFKSLDHHPLCWGMLALCGGDTICPFDFISFHKKGDGSADGVVKKGWKFVQDMHTSYPKLQGMKVANTEADILTGWSKSEDWRGDVRYAAMIVKVIIDYYNKFTVQNGVHIEMLSNDNGFLNFHPYYFTQRTLLTRFQMNNTHPPHIQFIKKPVYTSMALLSFLGNTAITYNVENVPNFSFMVTTNLHNKIHELSIIVLYVQDAKQNLNNTENLTFNLQNLLSKKYQYKYVLYTLNNIESNPYKVWKDFGSSVFPNSTVRKKMRKAEGPIRKNPPSDLPKDISIKLSVTLPTVSLLHVCSDNGKPPARVTGLQVLHVTTNEVLVVWKDHKINTKCIRTYEIEFLRDSDNSNRIEDQLFKRVNYDDVIFLWFQFVGEGTNGTVGEYRVRAMDYWERYGLYSKSVYNN